MEAEREEFVDFIARNPEAGKIVPATGGVRAGKDRASAGACA